MTDRSFPFDPLRRFEVKTVVSPDFPDRDEDADDPSPVPFPAMVLLESSLILAAILAGSIFGRNPLDEFEWSTNGAVAGLVATLPMLLFLWVSTRWRIEPLQRFRELVDRELLPHLRGASRLDFAMLALAAGVGEEMLFRGVLQAELSSELGIIGGLLATSLLFGFLHPLSTVYIAIATVLSLYLGAVWILSGNLLAVIIAHTLYDFVALIVLTHQNVAVEAD